MKSEKAVGTWRITSMEVWDADYVDMQVPAYLTIRDDLMGTFQFGLVQGDIDARVSEVDGVAHVEFSWSGTDENEPLSGRGWMDVAGSAIIAFVWGCGWSKNTSVSSSLLIALRILPSPHLNLVT